MPDHPLVTVTPAVPQFAFRLALPAGFRQMDLPAEQPDFSDLGKFMALGVFVDERTFAVVAVAARPGYPEGTVLDWLGFAASQQGMTVERFEPFATQAGPGASAVATQPNDGGPTRMRVVAVEDGGNFLLASAMCPVESWDELQPSLDAILASFSLVHGQGQTIPVAKADATGPTPPAAKTYADFALADDAASLDPEHRINASIRDNGRGLVPRVLNVDAARKCARVGAAAIMATFNVPLGWHVMDDAQRTLVFDAKNDIQVNLSLIDTGDANADVGAIFQAILADLAGENPEAQYQRLDLDGMPAMVVKGLVIGGEHLEQAYVLKRVDPRPGVYLKARVTITREHFVRAGDLLEVLLSEMTFVA
jgi:hypothetical protein